MRKQRSTAVVFLICYFSYAAAYICRLNFSVASPSMVSAGIISAAQVGFISSAFFCTYSIGQLINGFMGDKFRPVVMITLALVTAAFSNILIGFSNSFLPILVLWGINGYGQSMLWGPMLRGITATVEEKKRIKLVTLLISCAPLGSIAGIIIGTAFCAGAGFRYAFYVPGIIIFLMAGISALFLRLRQDMNSVPHPGIKKTFANRDIRAALLPAVFHGVIKDNLNVWLPLYFAGVFAINVKDMALYVFMIPITGLIGRVAYPLVYKRLGENEQRVSAVFFGVCALCAVPLAINGILALVAVILLSVISVAINIVNTSMLSIFPMRFVGSGNVSSVAGIMDFATYMGAAVSSFVYGIVVEAFGFFAMFISWTVLGIISIILIIKERNNTDGDEMQLCKGESHSAIENG